MCRRSAWSTAFHIQLLRPPASPLRSWVFVELLHSLEVESARAASSLFHPARGHQNWTAHPLEGFFGSGAAIVDAVVREISRVENAFWPRRVLENMSRPGVVLADGLRMRAQLYQPCCKTGDSSERNCPEVIDVPCWNVVGLKKEADERIQGGVEVLPACFRVRVVALRR